MAASGHSHRLPTWVSGEPTPSRSWRGKRLDQEHAIDWPRQDIVTVAPTWASEESTPSRGSQGVPPKMDGLGFGLRPSGASMQQLADHLSSQLPLKWLHWPSSGRRHGRTHVGIRRADAIAWLARDAAAQRTEKGRDRVNPLDGLRRASDLVRETRVLRHAVLPMVAAMASFRGGFE